MVPVIGILSCFTQPKWNIISITHANQILDGPLRYIIPVFMKRIRHICIPGRCQGSKIGCIPITFYKDNMIRIYFPDGIGDINV